jgi:hypothetical protein
MCIPCWPWTDIYLEDEPDKKDKGLLVWDPIAKTTVRLTGVMVSLFVFLFHCWVSGFLQMVEVNWGRMEKFSFVLVRLIWPEESSL